MVKTCQFTFVESSVIVSRETKSYKFTNNHNHRVLLLLYHRVALVNLKIAANVSRTKVNNNAKNCVVLSRPRQTKRGVRGQGDDDDDDDG